MCRLNTLELQFLAIQTALKIGFWLGLGACRTRAKSSVAPGVQRARQGAPESPLTHPAAYSHRPFSENEGLRFG